MNSKEGIIVFFSFPMLVLSWLLAIYGVYYVALGLFDLQTTEENPSLLGIFLLAFAFGATSISGIFASKANYFNSLIVRKIHKYSIVLIATLFLGYITFGAVIGVLQEYLS